MFNKLTGVNHEDPNAAESTIGQAKTEVENETASAQTAAQAEL